MSENTSRLSHSESGRVNLRSQIHVSMVSAIDRAMSGAAVGEVASAADWATISAATSAMITRRPARRSRFDQRGEHTSTSAATITATTTATSAATGAATTATTSAATGYTRDMRNISPMIMTPDGIAHITNPYISRACNIIRANIQLLRTEELFGLCKRVD